MFFRRLQVQERLTRQIAEAVEKVIKPKGVAVVIEARYLISFRCAMSFNICTSSHMCMAMRGVQKTSSKTVTSCMLGQLRTDQNAREEFLLLYRQN